MKQRQAKEKAKRSGNSMMSRILIPVIIALFVQAGLFSVNITLGGTIEKFKHNAFEILNGQVLNRRNYLENEMLERWSNLDPTAAEISAIFDRKPEWGKVDVKDSIYQNRILSQCSQKMISLLRRNLVTGVFLVLTDGEVYNEAGHLQKHALYIRDMDPATSSVNNSDLLLLYAPAAISKQLSIPLDSNWQTYMSFDPEASGTWNYYSKPYEAAVAYPEINEKDLGYWCPVFRQEGDSLDVITYSMPIRDREGKVHAILGVEISVDYLGKQMPYQELDTDKKGMYLIGTADGDSFTFDTQLSTGPFYKHRFNEAERLQFKRQEEYTDAFEVIDSTSLHKDEVYGCIQYFDLYNTNTPFEQERWALIGMMEGEQLLGFSHGMMGSIWLTWGLSLFLGLAAAWAASLLLARPITQLLVQLRESDPRHKLVLDKLNISEIDELSGAIETLSAHVAHEASRLSQIIDMAGVGIGAFESQEDSGRMFCTDSLFDMLGFEKNLESDGTIGRDAFDTLIEALDDQIEDQSEDGNIKILHIPHESGEDHWLRMKVVNTDERTMGVVSDITQEILKRRQLERERDYDLLTDLLNRRAFGVEIAKRFQSPEELGIAAMVMLDLDNLKFVNDSFGHDCGDEYIRSAANALRHFTPKNTLLARMSGDEFYVLFSGYSSREEVRQIISTLEEGVRQATFSLPDHSRINIRASAGVAWYPEHATSYETLLRYADFAMYQVKNKTKGEFGEFDLERYNRDSYLIRNQEEINRLIDQELVAFYFQPIVDARTGAVFGYEALMRPTMPNIKSPGEVLMLAKTQSKLYGVERLTWRRSLADFERLTGLDPNVRIFINSIANQLLNKKDSDQILDQFAHLLPRVVVEITEEEKSTETETNNKLKWAADWGCQVALDDFGTGYNSEAALLLINPDFVKLDISIVHNVDADVNRHKLMQNILSYAESRGIGVIAEGVETAAELQTVIGMGVDYIQGYYIARPKAQPEPIPDYLVKEIQEAYTASLGNKKS